MHGTDVCECVCVRERESVVCVNVSVCVIREGYGAGFAGAYRRATLTEGTLKPMRRNFVIW